MESKSEKKQKRTATSSPPAASWLALFSIPVARMADRHVSCETPYSTATVLIWHKTSGHKAYRLLVDVNRDITSLALEFPKLVK